MRRLPAVLLRALARGASWSASALTATSSWLAAYPSTDARRKEVFNSWKPHSATADQALAANLTTLVTQCRHLDRSTPLGRAVTNGLAADSIGNGIDVLPDSGADGFNKVLYREWGVFAEHALVDGGSLWDWQYQVICDLVTAGAALARFVVLPERLEQGRLPLAILPLEVEWLCEEAVGAIAAGNKFVRGIEVDKFGRPTYYHLRHPEAATGGERVAAEEIIHVFHRRRAQQTHGEPVLAPVVERILQDSRIIETELKAAVATAAPAIAITSENHPGGGTAEEDADGEPVTDIPAGSVARLRPGEDLKTVENKRPSQHIAPFRATIRGDVAAATGVSQFWLDRDPKRANYSSMRMDQLLTKRDLVRLKRCVGREAAGRVYEEIFSWVALKIGFEIPADPDFRARLVRHYLRPDQPEYVDPEKDVRASSAAVNAVLSTREQELAARGKEWRQVLSQNKREQLELDEATVGRVVELQEMIEAANKKNPELKLHWSHVLAISGAANAPGAYLAGVADVTNADADAQNKNGKDNKNADDKNAA